MTEDSLKLFVTKARIIWWILTIVITTVWIIILISLINTNYYNDSWTIKYSMLWILFLPLAVSFSFAISTFFLKLKIINTKNHRYVIYCGWYKDILLCDGEVVDMFKGMSFSSVNLEYDDGNGEKVTLKISQFFNSYTFKVNGKVLY